jgi:hypothetical protein
VRRRLATLLVPAGLALAGCGGGGHSTVSVRTVTAPGPAPQPVGTTDPSEVLSVGALGRLTGHCPRGAASWTLSYTASPGTATERVALTIAGGRRTVTVNPGESVAITVAAGRGNALGPPLTVDISQATEAQTLTTGGRLRFRSAAGESGRCVIDGALSISAGAS